MCGPLHLRIMELRQSGYPLISTKPSSFHRKVRLVTKNEQNLEGIGPRHSSSRICVKQIKPGKAGLVRETNCQQLRSDKRIQSWAHDVGTKANEQVPDCERKLLLLDQAQRFPRESPTGYNI